MDLEKGRYQKITGFRDVDMAEGGRISWMEHRTNEEVHKMTEEKRSLIGIIRSRQRNCMGNVMRGDSLLRTAIE